MKSRVSHSKLTTYVYQHKCCTAAHLNMSVYLSVYSASIPRQVYNCLGILAHSLIVYVCAVQLSFAIDSLSTNEALTILRAIRHIIRKCT